MTLQEILKLLKKRQQREKVKTINPSDYKTSPSYSSYQGGLPKSSPLTALYNFNKTYGGNNG